jgi:hypothetical protein
LSCGTHPHPGADPDPELLEEDMPAAVPPALARKKEPGAVRTLWRGHKTAIAPFAWYPATNLAGALTYLPYHGDWTHWMGAVAAEAVAAEGVLEVWGWRKKRSKAVRKSARRALTASTVWAMIAAGYSPAGWEGIVQWVLLATSVIWGLAHVHRMRRRQPAPPPEVAEPEPEPLAIPVVDPRQVAFSRRFCDGPGAELRGANVIDFTSLRNGFSLQVIFAEDEKHTVADVERLVSQIARLYDTEASNVSAGYVPGHRSEARALVIVQEPARTGHAMAVHHWDGESTYNPVTGMIDLGNFSNDDTWHYQLHELRSGAYMGFVAGVPGAGKTGTIHVIAAEAGLAKMCVRAVDGVCSCERCDLERVIAVFAADPQHQPLAVWRGRADLMGWDLGGSMELLQFLDTVGVERGHDFGEMEWTDFGPDGRARVNHGKGWFDPVPGCPLILAVFDEWPLMVNHPDKAYREEAMALALKAVTVWRKIGIHALFGQQVLDMSQTGIRELREMIKNYNAIAHRCDELSSNMAGIAGDPRLLSSREKGSAFTRGPDERDDKCRTKWIREYLKAGESGVDIRHLAEQVAQTPIRYDDAVLRSMEAFKIGHQGVFTEWRGADSPATPATGPAAAAGPVAQIDGLPTRDEADKVLAALRGNPAADLYKVMELTGMSALTVTRALNMLTSNGDLTQSNNQYTAA